MLFTRLKDKLLQPITSKSRNDRTLLGICIGIAFFFWLLVKLSKDYRTSRKVQFNISVPQGKTFTEDPPTDVQVTLEGSGWALLAELVRSRAIKVPYTLGEEEKLERSRGQLRTDIIGRISSSDLEIVDINYESLQLFLEDKAQKTVPIRLRSQLELAPDYQLVSPIRLSTDSVKLSGPQSVLQDITEWKTDSVSWQNIRNSQEQKLALLPPPDEISIDPAQVDVFVDVEQYTELSFFVSVEAINPPEDSIRIFPDKIKLSCSVGLSKYNQVGPDDFQITADLSGLQLSEGKNSVAVVLAKQSDLCNNVQLQRRSVEFYIIKKATTAEEENEN